MSSEVFLASQNKLLYSQLDNSTQIINNYISHRGKVVVSTAITLVLSLSHAVVSHFKFKQYSYAASSTSGTKTYIVPGVLLIVLIPNHMLSIVWTPPNYTTTVRPRVKATLYEAPEVEVVEFLVPLELGCRIFGGSL